MDIPHPAVTVKENPTEVSDYIVDFYPRDVKRWKVKQELPTTATIVKKDSAEQGELVSFYVDVAGTPQR